MNLAGPKLALLVVATVVAAGMGVYYLVKEDQTSYAIIAFDYQRAYHDLEYLAGDLDNRMSGTDNELAAARYVANQFNASGLANVQIHEFNWTLYDVDRQPEPSLTMAYEEESQLFPGGPTTTRRTQTQELDHLDDFMVLGYSGTLDDSSIELVFVGNGDEANYSAAGDVSGKAVLAESNGTLTYSQLYLAALENGATVSLVYDYGREWPIAKTSIGLDAAGHLIPFPDAYPEYADKLIPHLMVSNTSGQQMKDWINQAAQNEDDHAVVDVDVRVTIEGRPVRVVTGDIEGSSEDFIMLGAHMDTHYMGPGAVDNGVGTATVIELARQLANVTGLKKTLRLATWGGEEQGLLGSYGYFKAYREELDDDLVLYLNFDMDHADLENGADRIPLEVNDKAHVGPLEELRDSFFDQNPSLADIYQVPITYREQAGPSDHRTFNLEGFPSATSYGSGSEEYHTYRDDLSHINPESLQIAGRIEGSYALYLARR